VYEYDININDSVSDIYQQLTDRISRDFEVNDFHIVIAGLPMKEEADPIPKTSTRSFYEFFDGPVHGSCYIRKNVTRTTPEDFLNRINYNTPTVVSSCSVCLVDNIRVCSFYNCSHTMCINCNDLWRRATRSNPNNYRCPECRAV
jgi:hypothetical protein